MMKAEIQKALENHLNSLRGAGAQCELIASNPRPILLIEWKRNWQDHDFESALTLLTFAIGELSGGGKTCSILRCVDEGRLHVILLQGCDVEPADSVLWIDKFPSKPLEYGGEVKVMMVFDIHRTKPSYLEVPVDTDPNTLDQLRNVYRTEERSIDGSRLWFSRLPEHDKRVASGYEVEHGRWIPGDPMEALAGILVLGRDLEAIRESVMSSIVNCHTPKWG